MDKNKSGKIVKITKEIKELKEPKEPISKKNNPVKTETIEPSNLITVEELKEKMKDYKRVLSSDVKNIKPDTKIRYIEVLDEGFRYKPGGFLIVNSYPDYIVLVNGNRKWSVQLKNHIIFTEISIDSIRKEYEDIINKKNIEIDELKSIIQTKNKEIKKLNAK
jgi:archaellum component FlaC